LFVFRKVSILVNVTATVDHIRLHTHHLTIEDTFLSTSEAEKISLKVLVDFPLKISS